VSADPAGPSFTIEMLDAEGHPESLAGAHPDLLRLGFSLGEEGGSLRDLEIELPPGLGGSSDAVPQCPRAVYESEVECPPDSQVGRIKVSLSGGGQTDLPLFQIEPLPGEILALGSRPSLSLPLTAHVRPSDFGVTLVGHELPQGAVSSGELELWGIPADHQQGTSIPRRPFLTTPAECGPVLFNFRVRTWAEGAQWTSASGDTGASLTGCEGLAFEPRLGFTLSEPAADSPTGLSLDLTIPGEAEGSERAPAPARSITTRFPSGVGVSPSGAKGLVACTDAQFGLGDDAPPQCPAAAKVGSAEFVSSALGGPLSGTIYMAEGHPGETLRSFLVVPAPGLTLKLVSAMQADPVTGRLSTVMEGLPQAPIQRIRLEFNGGPNALFVTPLSCGRFSATATFTPYGGGAAVSSVAPVSISPAAPGTACAPPAFSPQLLVTSSNPGAGAPTTVSTVVRRSPGEQLLRSFASTMPAGISARLGTVKPCPGAAADLGSCPAGSRIGTAIAEIGSGANPATLRGDVYLTGPYRGAPLATLTRFDGRIGPLDLGPITSRAKLEVNRRTGSLTASTGDIPDQVEGLPIRFQSIGLDLDRPGFLRNPTSCMPHEATAVFESQEGTLASSSSRLQLSGCRRLRFKPRIRVALLGGGGPRADGGPVLRLTIRLRGGDSNLRSTRLVLPPELKLGIGGLKELCSRLDASQGVCPSGSRAGSAVARTPLLDGLLRGGVYMAQPDGDAPPDMWVRLSGAGLSMDLRSRSARAKSGRYVSVLGGMPDTPMSAFTMRLGGSSTVVSLRAGVCRRSDPRLFARVTATAQNGRSASLRVPIALRGACPRATQ
jgi:hypothetical protein